VRDAGSPWLPKNLAYNQKNKRGDGGRVWRGASVPRLPHFVFIFIGRQVMKKAQLHELLAVEQDLRSTKDREKDATIHTFTQRPDVFKGAIKTLIMFDENRKSEEGEGHEEVAETVNERLNKIQTDYIRYWDLRLQKETANQEAKADVIINGKPVFTDVPVTFLLNMETELMNLKNVYGSIPTLAPGIEWIPDEQKGRGIYKTAHKAEKNKTEKTIQFKVLIQPTKEHPGQVKEWSEDRPIGKFVTEVWSGMISPADKALMIGKLDKVLRAFKKARQRANCQETTPAEIGKQIFDYIHSS